MQREVSWNTNRARLPSPSALSEAEGCRALFPILSEDGTWAVETELDSRISIFRQTGVERRQTQLHRCGESPIDLTELRNRSQSTDRAEGEGL